MKHILCYGDSNTHGYIPGGGRYDIKTRWTGILADLLGSDYRIIEEGLNGRTSSLEDPFDPYKNGMEYIVPICILSRCKNIFAGRTSGTVALPLLNNGFLNSYYWDSGCY